MDGEIRSEEDRTVVHPYAVFCSRDESAWILQEETSGKHGKCSEISL